MLNFIFKKNTKNTEWLKGILVAEKLLQTFVHKNGRKPSNSSIKLCISEISKFSEYPFYTVEQFNHSIEAPFNSITATGIINMHNTYHNVSAFKQGFIDYIEEYCAELLNIITRKK